MAFKKAGLGVRVQRRRNLSPLATDSPGQLDVLGHDGDPLGMDGAQVGVLKESNKVGLTGFLESSHSRALEPQVSLEVLSNLTNQTLEGELADEELSGLLVTTDLTKSHSSRLVAVRLLDASSGWGTLAGSLGSQLLPWGLASSGLAGGLLGTSHCREKRVSLKCCEGENDESGLLQAVLFFYAQIHPPKSWGAL